ncbi:hypothetical protein DR999_PMT10773 [Platysternon megacephalum]|uniref:Uncharacterized protein n=1 Tax=Platysternon megacephalum TaxID=55544 RepID=A0A4D9EGE3_9SAUR|nr:hypothetical protein DR999_PMT10773 [Platysternon megacephalum]
MGLFRSAEQPQGLSACVEPPRSSHRAGVWCTARPPAPHTTAAFSNLAAPEALSCWQSPRPASPVPSPIAFEQLLGPQHQARRLCSSLAQDSHEHRSATCEHPGLGSPSPGDGGFTPSHPASREPPPQPAPRPRDLPSGLCV